MASPAENEKAVREALRFDCDPISEAIIGEGCGECAGCEGYAALAALRAQAEAGSRISKAVDEKITWETTRRQAAEARLAEAHKALRQIEHYPFDVMSDAVTDLRAVKEIARAALSGGPS